jgi:hypothetical protein
MACRPTRAAGASWMRLPCHWSSRPSSERKAARAFRRTSSSYSGIFRNTVRPPRSSHRSRGVGRSLCPFSASAWHWSDAADPLASPGIGTGMKCSSATRCADPWPASATASSMPSVRWPHGRPCARGEVRTSAWLWRSLPDLAGRRMGRQEADQKRDGTVFRAIRQVEREVVPQVDGLVYVSRWARDALLSWFPEAATVPYAVIGNFRGTAAPWARPRTARGPCHHRSP